MAYDLAFIILIFIYMFYYFAKKVIIRWIRRRNFYNKYYYKSCFNNNDFDKPSNDKNSFINQKILLEGLEDKKTIDIDILNDRYNPFKKSYSDNMLFSKMIERTMGDNVDMDYNDILVNELRNGSYSNDIDTKIYKKNQRSQSLARDNQTISAFSSRNSIGNSYKDELDYNIITRPWWE